MAVSAAGVPRFARVMVPFEGWLLLAGVEGGFVGSRMIFFERHISTNVGEHVNEFQLATLSLPSVSRFSAHLAVLHVCGGPFWRDKELVDLSCVRSVNDTSARQLNLSEERLVESLLLWCVRTEHRCRQALSSGCNRAPSRTSCMSPFFKSRKRFSRSRGNRM